MGLDMYLSAKKYVGGWAHSRNSKDDEARAEVSLFDQLVKVTGMTPDSGAPSFYVECNVGYWRKANAIHSWFVKNVQDGRDECQRENVSREQLETLRGECLKVLDTVEVVDGDVSQGTTYKAGEVIHHTKRGKVVAQKDVASKVLPTQSGFFFGSTDYDEYYIEDLKQTVEIIDRVLGNDVFKDCSFIYHSNW